MKQTAKLFIVAMIAGLTTLAGYKLLDAPQNDEVLFTPKSEIPNFTPTSYTSTTPLASSIDFTGAAEKTVNAVVHVQNTTVSRRPSNIMEYFMGRGEPKMMIGTGSGVIITPDGYIVTNNHVVANSSELEVTLNNNKIYKAELIGADPNSDIALIKIEPDEDLPVIPFGDSNELKVGEWVLAVGNPFRLNSTVTAGIVSAKARDLNEYDSNPQSFIQTDAAVNRGNSGGALVNVRGELIGINTAIASETGSYVGYSFAVPSNNARKIIEDIMEYGDVQRGILGIQGGALNSKRAEYLGINETEGFYINGIEKGSGAEKGGLQEGDIIKELDGYKVSSFSELAGYIGSKRPNDVVDVTILRKGRKRVIPVTLVKLETVEIPDLGLELKNATSAELKSLGVDGGVKINRITNREMQRYDLEGLIITRINDQKVEDIDDAKRIVNRRDYGDDIKLTLIDRNGQPNTIIFR
jgi:Do/DeqQ family serine protease